MTTKEIKEQRKTIRTVSKTVKSSKRASQDFLIRVGIHTKTGRLAKPYRD